MDNDIFFPVSEIVFNEHDYHNFIEYDEATKETKYPLKNYYFNYPCLEQDNGIYHHENKSILYPSSYPCFCQKDKRGFSDGRMYVIITIYDKETLMDMIISSSLVLEKELTFSFDGNKDILHTVNKEDSNFKILMDIIENDKERIMNKTQFPLPIGTVQKIRQIKNR